MPSALDSIRKLAEDRGLNPAFPPDVEAEAHQWLITPGIDDPGLTDLTALPFCTIDYPTSKDLDQAVFIERLGGGWRVWYAIADASYYVRPEMALYTEALRRGCTVYLPGLIVRMLPETLSEGLVSLMPEVDRRSVVFRMDVGADGTCHATQLFRARVHSQLKTSYAAVQVQFDGGTPVTTDPRLIDSLQALAEVGRARINNAEGRGVVRVRRSEVAVDLADAAGLRFVALREGRNDVERYNEQISLLANAEGARILAHRASVDADVQPIYRVMEPPSRRDLADLRTQIDALVAAHGRPSGWRWDPETTALADYLANLPEDPVAQAIHRRAMLVGGRAAYVPTPGPHAGVGSDIYARFTAPMREIIGVFLHAELLNTLDLAHESPHVDDKLQSEVIAAAGRSRGLQRDMDRGVNELVLDQMFADDLAKGTVRGATVAGLSSDKVHLWLDDPPIDVKLYLRHLAQQLGQPLHVDAEGVRLVKADGTVVLTVGGTIQFAVSGRDAATQRWALQLR